MTSNSKIAIVTDLHFGARNDSLIMDNYFQKFYDEVFFPYIDEHKIDTVFDLGDTFDRRKYINFNILQRCKSYFFDKLKERNIDFHVIAGNHDCYWKNTNDVNTPDLLLQEYGFNVYYSPKTVNVKGLDVAFLPWIASDNYKESMEFVNSTPAKFLFGHLELAGFEMHRGSISVHGFDKNLFDKFDLVTTGHYHTKSRNGNIFYPGTAYEMTWADYDDPKGFNVFDVDSKQFTFVRNPNTLFTKVIYNDKNVTDFNDIEIPEVDGKYTKVIIQEKTNPYFFDMYLNALDKQAPIQVQTIEANLYLGDDDEDFLEGCEDTLTLLKKYCEQVDTTMDKNRLFSFMETLYNEALITQE